MLFAETIAAAVHQKELDGVITDPNCFFVWHAKAVLKAFANHALCDITTDMLEEYRHARATSTSNANANRDFQILRFTFRLAVRKGWIKKSPLDDLSVRELPEDREGIKFLEVPETQALSDGAASVAREVGKSIPKWTAPISDIVTICTNTGMQRREVLRLEKEWVSLGLKLLRLPKIKKRPPRDIPMNEVCLQVVKRLYRKAEGKYLIVNPRTGKPFTRCNKSLKSAAKRAGLAKHVTLHRLRHTFGTACLTAGVSLETVQELLGHLDLQTTKVYSKVISRVKKDAVRAVEALHASPAAPEPDERVVDRPAGNVVYFEKFKKPKNSKDETFGEVPGA